MNAPLKWSIAAALVAAAWGVTLLAPTEDAAGDAFVTDATIGERTEGRNIAATVWSAQVASTVSDESGWQAQGTWLVVEVSAEAVASQPTGLLAGATLQIGERTFSASERGPEPMTIYRTQLVPGVSRTGSLLFELPEDALHGTGILLLSTGYLSWGDTILRLELDLDSLERVSSLTVADVEWTTP